MCEILTEINGLAEDTLLIGTGLALKDKDFIGQMPSTKCKECNGNFAGGVVVAFDKEGKPQKVECLVAKLSDNLPWCGQLTAHPDEPDDGGPPTKNIPIVSNNTDSTISNPS